MKVKHGADEYAASSPTLAEQSRTREYGTNLCCRNFYRRPRRSRLNLQLHRIFLICPTLHRFAIAPHAMVTRRPPRQAQFHNATGRSLGLYLKSDSRISHGPYDGLLLDKPRTRHFEVDL